MASIKEIDKLIRAEPSKALQELNAMSKQDRAKIARADWSMLCESAIFEENLELVNTILKFNGVEPLAMDSNNIGNYYHSENTKGLIKSESLVLYRNLVRAQRAEYCNEISSATTRLKRMAAETLSELVSDNTIKKALQDPKNDRLDRTIQDAELWLAGQANRKVLMKTKTYAEFKAASTTAKELDTSIANFIKQLSSIALIQETHKSLKHPRNACLYASQGFRGILNDIGNAINRFIGKVKAWHEGKLDEFKEHKVEVSGFKARLENIKSAAEDVPSFEDQPSVSAPKR